jgi:apolipoprotein N-acyltransferase
MAVHARAGGAGVPASGGPATAAAPAAPTALAAPADRCPGMSARLLWLLLAVAGGVVWGLAFGRVPLGLGAWLALAPLPLLLSHRRAGSLAFLHGFACWETGLYWIVPTLRQYGGISLPLAVLLTSILAAYLALFHAAFGWLGGPLWRRASDGDRWAPALWALPALWVALEWLRTYFLGGFPWNLSAYAWIAVPGALPLAAFLGAYGISFLVMLVAVAVAAATVRLAGRRPRPWRPLAAGLLAPLLLLPVAGRWSLRRAAAEGEHQATAGVPVRLLQPNVANQAGWDPQRALRDYYKVVAMSRAACQPGTLVIWPESAGWPFEYRRDELLDRDLEAMAAQGCGVLFNSDSPAGRGDPHAYNSAWLLAPGGAPPLRYDKRHLVPFGEYVPFERVLFFAKTVARNIGQFLPAERLALLPWRGELLGPAICYEVVFPEETAALAEAGATILVTITNDGWYGDTWAPWQHLRAARFRAAESRRPMLRAAITGVSAVIAPDGSVRAELGVGEEGVIRAMVRGERQMTPYARLPWLPPLAATVVAVAAILALGAAGPLGALGRRRRSRRSRQAREPAAAGSVYTSRSRS